MDKLYIVHDFIVTHNSKIVLDILTNIKKDKPQTTLILSPNVSSVATWTEEIEKHSSLTSIELVGETSLRWDLLKNSKNIAFF